MIELVYGLGILGSLALAWCLGANDAANPTECAVGAGVISLKKGLIIFAIFAALGGILIGSFVMKTVDRGIVDRETAFEVGELTNEALIVGSFTVVLAAILWIIFCTWKGMPVLGYATHLLSLATSVSPPWVNYHLENSKFKFFKLKSIEKLITCSIQVFRIEELK